MHTTAVVMSKGQHTNEVEGTAYTLLAIVTPDGADPSASLGVPCIFYLKNTSDANLVITDVRTWAESAEYIDVYFNQTGTPIGGNEATPINMNLSSGKQASGVFLGSSRITGMSGGNLFDRLRVQADDGDHLFTWEEGIIMPKNTILTVYAGTGGISIETSISFYYHPEEG
jgi:hypothetical protein